jgi:hypothetical protein
MPVAPARRIQSGIAIHWGNIVADALSCIPIEESFFFEEEEAFPLNLVHLERKQLTNNYLQLGLQKQPPDCIKTKREGNKVDVFRKTEAIYIPASLRPAILQWYHTSLHHPSIKCM